MFHQLALVGLVRGREEAGDKGGEKGGWSMWGEEGGMECVGGEKGWNNVGKETGGLAYDMQVTFQNTN